MAKSLISLAIVAGILIVAYIGILALSAATARLQDFIDKKKPPRH